MRGMLFRSSPEYAYSSHSVSHAAIAEVLHAGAEKCPPGKSATIRRDHYLLHLVLSGRGELRTGGKSYLLSSHDCFLLRPGQEHVYRADAEHPWEYVWPGFSGVDDEILGELYGGFPRSDASVNGGETAGRHPTT
ncbi:MAG: AraC family ligand binding domain-containing protein [Spirochaetaceae bacterium]